MRRCTPSRVKTKSPATRLKPRLASVCVCGGCRPSHSARSGWRSTPGLSASLVLSQLPGQLGPWSRCAGCRAARVRGQCSGRRFGVQRGLRGGADRLVRIARVVAVAQADLGLRDAVRIRVGGHMRGQVVGGGGLRIQGGLGGGADRLVGVARAVAVAESHCGLRSSLRIAAEATCAAQSAAAAFASRAVCVAVLIGLFASLVLSQLLSPTSGPWSRCADSRRRPHARPGQRRRMDGEFKRNSCWLMGRG